MELVLKRVALKEEYTIGRLFVNGEYFSDTIEDCVRKEKIYGKTAIPYGKYEVLLDVVSPKFKERSWAKPYQGKVPRLKDVPNFEGVLIHVGTDQDSTSGCIIVGKNKEVGKVLESRLTFMSLMEKHLLPAKKRKEKVTIEII